MSRKTTMWKRATLVAAVGTAALASGCAEEREPISWVQPNVLDKTFFVGKDLQDPADDPEFYTQGTLIDVGYGASQNGLFTSTYAQQTSRMKWVITEDSLVARLTHERIEGSDGKGIKESALQNEGVVVASFKIQSHFDIQKQYNPTTGEELNVIVENTTDRPWNERKYFRVDWSSNENVDAYDFDMLSMLGIFGGVKYTPMKYFINDPMDPNAPHFATEEGYFDVTTKVFAEPGEIDLRRFGWGIDSFPSCFLPADFLGGTAPAGSCNPVELTVRHSFRRIEPTDYEPADWDGHRFRAFGAFTAERYGYTRRYGMTDDKWHRFIARYNIWERSHFYADPVNMEGAIECYTDRSSIPNLDDDANGTADECEGVTAATGLAGSQCDTFNQKCTLPYRARTQKPIAWYYTTGSNPEFFEPSHRATHDWDVAFRSAGMVAKYTECVATGGEAEACKAEFPVLDGQQIDNDNATFLANEVDFCRDSGKPEAECVALAESIGQDRGFSAGVIALAKRPEALVLCHSPVEAKDPAACGGPRLPEGITAEQCTEAMTATGNAMPECRKALNARIGDLRYHQVNVIQAPQTPSPWGIMVDAEDPLTGEKVAASVNVWSHVNDFISQSLVDTARFIKGELTAQDVTDGTFVGDWVGAMQAVGNGNGMAPKFSKADREKAIADFSKVDVEQLEAIKTSAIGQDMNLRQQIRDFDQMLRTDIVADAYAPTTNAIHYEARRERALGSQVEAELSNIYMQQLAGTAGLPLTDMNRAFSSPLRGNNPVMMRELRRMKELALADRNACMLSMAEAPAPIATADIANLLEAKFGAFNPNDSKAVQLERAERMRKFLARRMHYNVMAHEMGHSVGLRHNFVSSSDAYSYRPQYWQLRTANGTQTELCSDYDADGACVGPRYFDPITQDEKDNFLQMFMQSTVMDYAGEYLQDMIGLGVYDFAATRMFYGHTIAVHADTSYNVGTPRGTGMIEKADNFGGTVGIQYSIGEDNDPSSSTSMHYSALQNAFQLIKDCEPVDPSKFQPSTWNEELDGEWHPTFDGYIVQVGGEYTRCKQQPVDYVPFQTLRAAVPRVESGFNREGPTVDKNGRTRVPYGFATDRWADLGNLSVYRHDNGADAYELFDFFITSQEMNHIFDNYRRNRTTFSIKGAAYRTLGRYNEKMRDGAKGLGLMANIYRDFALENGWDFNTLWPFIADLNFGDNIMASALAFDHFTRQLARPEPGPHYLPTRGNFNVAEDGVLRSDLDTISNPGRTRVVVPNGATGVYGMNVSYGGKLVENTLAEDRDKGEYAAEYTLNAGSYYDKVFTPMLMTESYDNFISDSRRDFTDPRYRAVSMADLFPEGFRRWLGNNLTGDDQLKGVRVAADDNGRPVLEDGTSKFPKMGLGWTQWWPVDGPRTCFTSATLGLPGEGSGNYLACDQAPVNTAVIDPQVGWEQQKFLIASTLMFLPENQKQYWLNRMWVWELGTDNDPGFQNRIEFHDPVGRIYVAKTFGKEEIYGKVVEKGISARVLEYANELLAKAYVVTPVDNTGDGVADWYEPVFDSAGQPVIRFDPQIAGIDENGNLVRNREGCNETLMARYDGGDATALDEMNCTCEENVACDALSKYTAVPYFLREAIGAFGLGGPGMKGIY
ncbi:hypothetical protein [Vulgatibacter sp.]|uniref:hypothetical protein n=1 Tax=Vulgatibacter sp. TaxID=1971226 RepID=UPI003561DDF4